MPPLTLIAGTAPAGAKDTLSLGMQLEPPYLDPTAGAASAIREVTYANLFEGLTRIDAGGKVVPGLAADWTISPDGLTYTFHLRQGVKFHDGTRFDCSIVKFSYDRAVAPGSTNAQKGLFAPIASTECPDPNTAVVTLKQPASNFLFDMGWGDAVMVAPNSAANNKTNPVGTGPFRFKRWVKGDRVELERNPDYWGAKPALAAVTFRFIPDPTAATAAMMAGDLDAYPNFPAPEAIDQFKSDPRFTVKIGTTEGKLILALNDAKKPFDDVRVRRALASAIDRKRLHRRRALRLRRADRLALRAAGPGLHRPHRHLSVSIRRRRSSCSPRPAIAPGTSITITLPPPAYARRGGEVIAAELQQVGINARLVPIEWAQWLDQVFAHSDFDSTIIAHTEARDLDIYARDKYYFNYHSPEYKALYQQYLAALDPKAQLDLVQKLQRQLATDEPNVFIAALPKIGVWNAKLRGMWANNPIPANDVTGVTWSE